MWVVPLLFALTLSASPSAISSSTFNFDRNASFKSTLSPDKTDGVIIEVISAEVHTLSISLVMSQGDAEMGVIAEVNGSDVFWMSSKVGNELLEIRNTDRQLTDGQGLKRLFFILVHSTSRTKTTYTLTVTAQGGSSWKSGSGETMKAHVDARKADTLFTMKPYEGDAQALLQSVTEEGSWWGVVGGLTLLGAGILAWRKWGGSQGKSSELKYRLI